ncbi:phage portal protein [Arthrobacter sp. UYCu712]|uniref:phage portal protein n=1 Tax=Arthrobacter sp. UYCu712 TaxID=3156340 RepID=UPI0033983164
MAAILKAGGELVTIGSFGGGYPTRSSWGDTWITRDAGIPLSQYSPATSDPMALWKSQPSLRKVVSFIARQVGHIPWHAYQRVSDTDRQREQGSPAEQLLNRASRFRSGYNLWRDVVTDALLYDLFCVVYFAAHEGKPARLVRIPPRLIELKSNFLGEVEQVILHTPAGQEDVDLTEAPMAISWGWSADGGAGVSPLLTLSQILEENKRSVQWRRAQWDNSPKLSGVLMYEKGFKDDRKRDRFLQSWRQWRDSVNAGGTPILEDGMTYEQLDGINPKDAKDIEGRQLTDAEVASAFHIAPELVGARAGNFSNIGAFRQMLHGPTLGPLYTELTQAVNIGLLPFLDTTRDLYVEMDRDAAINGSFLEQAQILSTATGGPWLLRSEARAKQNLPFVEGTDELVVPLNVVEGGQASPHDSGTQNEKPGTPE